MRTEYGMRYEIFGGEKYFWMDYLNGSIFDHRVLGNGFFFQALSYIVIQFSRR